MIKVKDTKTHKVSEPIRNSDKDIVNVAWKGVLVTDAELVLVECEEVKHAILHNIINKNGKFYKPIYISRTEKIVDGDFYYDHINNLIKRFDPMYDCLSSKDDKVLALPEHFSPKQLQDIVDGKLKEGKCLVECERYSNSYATVIDEAAKDSHKHEIRIKLNPHITIYPVEEKMFTRDEVNQVVIKYLTDYSDLEWKEWFEQNVK